MISIVPLLHMKEIRDIVHKDNPSLEELIRCFEIVKDNGGVAIIKFDGQRSENWYTTLISLPSKGLDMLRADEGDLKIAIANKKGPLTPVAPWKNGLLSLELSSGACLLTRCPFAGHGIRPRTCFDTAE
jgi:hypothetical protein